MQYVFIFNFYFHALLLLYVNYRCVSLIDSSGCGGPSTPVEQCVATVAAACVVRETTIKKMGLCLFAKKKDIFPPLRYLVFYREQIVFYVLLLPNPAPHGCTKVDDIMRRLAGKYFITAAVALLLASLAATYFIVQQAAESFVFFAQRAAG